MSLRYGATAETWFLFSDILDLTADMLPAVGNPNAKISANSSMASIGQIPSRYNARDQVVGFPKWTSYTATAQDIERWQEEPDYNIALQCRRVMALDCDVTVNPQADEILAWLDHFTQSNYGVTLPLRRRQGSTKWLALFLCEGDYRKKVVKVDGGIIENLARGQQFILEGTHPSGSRYVLDMRGNSSLPVLSGEQYTAVWSGIVDKFGLEAATEIGSTTRKREANINVEDTTLEHLEVLSWGKNGEAFITCPFNEEHTTESGPTATVYFPAGTNGYQQGHFKCLHAHCSGKSDHDFIEALGVREAQFDIVEAEPASDKEPGKAEKIMPPLERMESGRIKATLPNLQKILNAPEITGVRLRHDTFREEIMFASKGKDDWQQMNDVFYIELRERLEKIGFIPIGRELIRDAVMLVADRNKFDSAEYWLNSLEWDGVRRVSSFANRCLGSEDTQYTRAVSRYMWTAMAGRILQPGVKADMVPILQGAQGRVKSSAIEALVPSEEFFVEISLSEKEDDLARRTKGCLVAEIGELRGLNSRDLESIKAYVVRKHDKWIPKYREQPVNYARRLVFFGTTNDDEFLADRTGNRRWLPFTVNLADKDAIIRERDQLWAEARELFNLTGVCWQEAEQLADKEHGKYMISDAWENEIATWLDTPIDGTASGETPADAEFIMMKDILVDCLGIPISKISRVDEARGARALKDIGYVRRTRRVGGRCVKAWVKDPLYVF